MKKRWIVLLRDVLLKLSEDQRVEQWARRSEFMRRVSRRFIAGETLTEAILAARELNASGMRVTLDALGEHAKNLSDAERACNKYLVIFDGIEENQLIANVSLKLTQLGLGLDEAACRKNLKNILNRALHRGTFVRLDMENSAYTERTLNICKEMHNEYPSIGAVIQAYLHRSEEDVRDLIKHKCRIRLCKGAYRESPNIAWADKADVDRNYIRLMNILLQSDMYHAIATHDPRMIDATVDFAAKNGVKKTAFEFQMLYGIRQDIAMKLTQDGYAVRVYLPFGSEWFSYFTRRLAERPANVLFFLKNYFR